MMDNEWPKKITLQLPLRIIRNGTEQEVTELVINKPVAKHLKFIPVGGNEQGNSYFVVPLVAALAGIQQKEADEIELVDILKVADLLLPFLNGFL